VPLSMCNWRDSVDDTRGCHLDSESGRTHQYSRSYWEPAIKRWTLRTLSLLWGTDVFVGSRRQPEVGQA
jgi:hypothetical protein